MGILNVTPDSFSEGGELLSVDAVIKRAMGMIADGADVLDIGGGKDPKERPDGVTS